MSCCVVIPVYRKLFEPLEIVSFMRLRQLMDREVFLVAPNNLDLSSYLTLWPNIGVIRFDNACFESISSYNKLMLSSNFYESFAGRYEWLLIHQLDAFLFNQRLIEFCEMPYDYYGAPWRPAQLILPRVKQSRLLQFFGKRVVVGNGGLSLRRLSSVIDLLSRKKSVLRKWNKNEDGFFAYYGSGLDKFKTCPVSIASRFAIELQPCYWIQQNNGELPFGCHAFDKVEKEIYARMINPILKQIPGLSDSLRGADLPLPYQI